MFTLSEPNENGVVSAIVSGELTREDYDRALPQMETLLDRYDTLRFYIDLTDMTGMEAGALWEDAKFDARHMDQYGRTAVIGDSKWQEWVIEASDPLFKPKMKFFRPQEKDDAWTWVNA